ncbi:ABC transporter ATP-binding protein [Streptococcus ruminicola]|uniref:ATP-binding cassette domain-containing protein n=1 Tax=Streptococcus ruminicola TaxID=2686210 RepID=UPI0039828D60
MIIKIQNFSKKFRTRNFFIEQNISIELDNGKVTFLTGNNGSGKSTLMKILAGILQINTGEIKVCEQKNFLTWSKFNCYYMPSSEKGLTHKLTGLENIIYLCSLKGNSKGKTLNVLQNYIKNFSINGLLDMKVGEMSTGQKRLVHILAALCSPCKILLFDEPTISLDDRNVECFVSLIQEYKKRSDRKFIIVSHERNVREQLMEEEYFIDEYHNIVKIR